MNRASRALFVIGVAWGACACSSKPLPQPRGLPDQPLVHELSGGPRTPEIEAKKARLMAEYRELESAEAELDEKRLLLMTQVAEDPSTNHTQFTQAEKFGKSGARLTRQQEVVAELERELREAGVSITAHR